MYETTANSARERKIEHVQKAIQMSRAWMYETRGSLSRVALELVTNVNMVVMPSETLAGAELTFIQKESHEIMTKSTEGR